MPTIRDTAKTILVNGGIRLEGRSFISVPVHMSRFAWNVARNMSRVFSIGKSQGHVRGCAVRDYGLANIRTITKRNAPPTGRADDIRTSEDMSRYTRLITIRAAIAPKSMSSNTDSSWRESWDGSCSRLRTSTTRTATAPTIGTRILNFGSSNSRLEQERKSNSTAPRARALATPKFFRA